MFLALVLSTMTNAIFIGLYLAKRDECKSYKEKANHWLESYNRVFNTCYELLKKENKTDV